MIGTGAQKCVEMGVCNFEYNQVFTKSVIFCASVAKEYALVLMFHADDNYTTIEQRICLDIVCNKSSGTMYDFTPLCDSHITCPLEAGRNYQITEKQRVNNNFPSVSFSNVTVKLLLRYS